jgi:hypothetical protein
VRANYEPVNGCGYLAGDVPIFGRERERVINEQQEAGQVVGHMVDQHLVGKYSLAQRPVGRNLSCVHGVIALGNLVSL